MDENTIFQGVSPAPSVPPQPVQPPQPVSPMQNLPQQPVPQGQITTTQPLAQGQPFVPQPISTSPQQPIPPLQQPVYSTNPSVGVPAGVPPMPPPPPPPVAPASIGGVKRGSSFLKGTLLKIILGLLLLVIVGFFILGVIMPLFAGNSNEKVTLTYWGLWEDPNVMQKAIDEFQKQNPNIIIKYEKQDIKQQYRNRLLTRIKNGNGPDIFQFHNTWVSQMDDVLTPVPTDVITPDQFRKAYYPVISNDVIKNGAIYGIPLQIDTLALYTNTEMLSASSVEAPTNWEDFGKTARALTVKDENGKIKTAGAALGTYDNITHAPDILSLLFLQNGADINDLSSTETQSIDTLTYYTQDYAMGDSNVWDTSLDSSLLAFAKGNLAMYFGYSWDMLALRAMNPELQFQVTPVPHLALGRKITIASYWVEGVSQKSKHQKQAMLFMKYLSKKETLQKLFTEASKTRPFGQLYPRPDLEESLKDNEYLSPFVSQASDATSTFFVSDTYDDGLNQKANTYLGNAVRSMLDSTSAETALEALSEGIAQVLREYGYK